MLKRVLAVDDSTVTLQMFRLFFSSYKDCRLVTARDGSEALDTLAREEIDLILLDINMPVMNGLEFLARVQQEPAYQNIPVIIVSTEGREEDVLRGLRMGARAYVRKPFQAAELHELVAKLLAGPSR